MNRNKKVTLSIIALGALFLVGIYADRGNLSTKVVNIGTRSYYEDKDGVLWENRQSYEDYIDENYYVAPDGSYWENEYRYTESIR